MLSPPASSPLIAFIWPGCFCSIFVYQLTIHKTWPCMGSERGLVHLSQFCRHWPQQPHQGFQMRDFPRLTGRSQWQVHGPSAFKTCALSLRHGLPNYLSEILTWICAGGSFIFGLLNAAGAWIVHFDFVFSLPIEQIFLLRASISFVSLGLYENKSCLTCLLNCKVMKKACGIMGKKWPSFFVLAGEKYKHRPGLLSDGRTPWLGAAEERKESGCFQ